MELDIFDTKLNRDVLGVEFCTSFIDKNGLVQKGFYCHREDLLFCCGDAQAKYCCSRTERLAQQLQQLEQSGLTSVLNTRAVSMITLISASVLTFIITIALTAFTISTCQRIFAKKFRSNCTTICSENGCNANDLGADLCRSASVVPASVPLPTAALLVPSPTGNVDTSNHSGLANHLNSLAAPLGAMNNVNTLNDQANYAGPISNCSSTSTDQCTIDTNSTMITNLSSETSNSAGPAGFTINYTGYGFSPNLNQTNFQPSLTNANNPSLDAAGQPAFSLNRLTSALASITSMLTSGGSQRNQTSASNNSLFHISGSDQLTDMIISQPPPPAYEQSYPTGELPRTDLQEGYPLQLPTSYYNNELCT